MKNQTTIEHVSSWYKTDGFYKQLVALGFESVKPFLKGKKLLEIGPADGAMTKFFTHSFRDISLLEPSHKYATMLHKSFPGATIHESLVENFVPPTTYDTIVMAHVLEHVTKPVAALNRIKRAMNQKSRLIIIVPNANSIHRLLGVAMGLIKTKFTLNAYDKKLGHQRVYDGSNLAKHVQRAGLRIVSQGGIMLKPLSNDQMKSWNPDIIRGLFNAGRQLPDLCAEIYVVCVKSSDLL